MTDKDIINQWKHERELAECVCSYFVDQVELSLVNETIDLINRQQAENKELAEAIHNLTIEKDALFDKAEELKAKIERLQKLLDDKCDRCIARDKSEAIKEFASRLKCGVPQEYGVISCYDVDNLVKEMVGDKKMKCYSTQKARTKAIEDMATVMYVAVANVLTDKLHFGKVKVQQTLKQIEKVFDMLAEGRMSLDDCKSVLYQEYGVTIK